jgi:voltage-gated potassium channel Kch
MRLLRAIFRSWHVPAFRAALALTVLILLSGTIFYRSVEGWTWTDALYFSATTISTLGLGDPSPQTQVGKLFTIIYIFVGVGVFTVLVAHFAKALLRGHDEDQVSIDKREQP